VSAILDYARDCGFTKNVVAMPWQEEGEGAIHFLQRDEEQAVAGALRADEAKVLRLNFDDEILKGCVVTHSGKIVNEKLAAAAVTQS